MSDDLYTTEALLQETSVYKWVLEGILPVGGRLLFHGREGLGKSLLAMRLALCVLRRGRLFGEWQSSNNGGSVLYVQADLPKILHRDRVENMVKRLPWISKLNLHHFCPAYFDILSMEEGDELTVALQATNPCLVIWDVLRAIAHEREEEHIPGIVYGQMHTLFPNAAHFIIHHDRKITRDSSEGYLDHREAFSGMKTWVNLVVSAWHLEEDGGYLKLSTTKNNCGPKNKPILLQHDPLILLPVNRMSRASDEIDRWRLGNKCEDRDLTPQEKLKIGRFLIASGVAPLGVVSRLVEEL